MKTVQFIVIIIFLSSFSSWAQEKKKKIQKIKTEKEYYNTPLDKKKGILTKHLINTEATDFKLRTLKGDSVQLSDLRGKVVFINVFFTNCGGCVYKIPFINKLVRKYSKKDIMFITISPYDTPADFLTRQKRVEAQGRVGKFDERVKVIPASYLGKRLDGYYRGEDKIYQSKEFKNVTEKLLKEKYGATMAPMAYFIDKKGIIRFIAYGYDPNDYDFYPFYTNEIDKLLAETYIK